MKIIIATTTLFFLTVHCLQAQNNLGKWRYASHTQGGIAAGTSTVSYTAQTVQGIQKNGLFTGVGFGMDDYGMAGLPLVALLQKSFPKKDNKPFIYSQAGIVLPLKKGKWGEKVWLDPTRDQYDLHNGFLAEMGGGYLFGLGKNKRHAISLSAGYSYKHSAATYTQLAWPPYLSSLPPAGYNKYVTEEHRYNYHRVVVKAGFMF